MTEAFRPEGTTEADEGTPFRAEDESPDGSTLTALAVLALLGGAGAAVGLARTSADDDTAQVVYIAMLALAGLGLSLTAYLAQRRAESAREALSLREAAVTHARWQARRLVRQAREIASVLGLAEPASPSLAQATARIYGGRAEREWSAPPAEMLDECLSTGQRALRILLDAHRAEDADELTEALD